MYKKMCFNFARDSLAYAVKEFEIEQLWIPYYLCDVIRHKLVEISCKPLFYHIDDRFLPIPKFNRDDYVLYPNYFGVCDRNVEQLIQEYPRLIVDNAHSYYSKPKGIICFNSAKKFKNVKMGSDLYIKSSSTDTEIEITKEEQEFLVKQKKEFEGYCSKYSSTNMLKFISKDVACPFCYPYLATTEGVANDLVKKLEMKGKTIYRYWNALPQSYNEYKFYSRLVPIPLSKYGECD